MPTQAQIEAVLANPERYSDAIVAEARELAGEAPRPPAGPTGPVAGPEKSVEGFLGNVGPSALQAGGDIVGGLGALLTSPIDTIQGMPAGLAGHYGSRYNSLDQAGDTLYNDPVGAALDVPVIGTGLRFLGAAGKVAGAGRVAEAASQTGRMLERLDPISLGMSGLQGATGAAMNTLMPNRTPEAVMAGTEYGGVQGRQNKYLHEYYDDVGRALDEGYGNTLGDVDAAEAALGASKKSLGDLLNAADDVQVKKVDIVRAMEELKAGKTADLDASYLDTIDRAIRTVLEKGDATSPYLTPALLNEVKSKLQGKVNWDAVDTPGLDQAQAFADTSRAARLGVREAVPGAAGALDEVRQLTSVEDLVRRGHVQNMPNIGGGTAGSFLAQGVDLLAPIVTGQRKNVRNAIRRDIREMNLGGAAEKLTRQTPYGIFREGAYIADMEEEDATWHVGRLWNEE